MTRWTATDGLMDRSLTLSIRIRHPSAVKEVPSKIMSHSSCAELWRATDATGHKIATQHTKPQGFIIRSPLQTTNKVFLCPSCRASTILSAETTRIPIIARSRVSHSQPESSAGQRAPPLAAAARPCLPRAPRRRGSAPCLPASCAPPGSPASQRSGHHPSHRSPRPSLCTCRAGCQATPSS